MITAASCSAHAGAAGIRAHEKTKMKCVIVTTVIGIALEAVFIGLAFGLIPKLFDQGKISLFGFKVITYIASIDACIVAFALTAIFICGMKELFCHK